MSAQQPLKRLGQFKQVLPGASEFARRRREFDWSKSPPGPIDINSLPGIRWQ